MRNETRGAVFKKQQFITVCYSTCVRIEMKQEGQFSKKNNLLQYAIQLVCILKWNKRDSFQKTPIYYSMLFNLCAYWNETRGTVFKKNNLWQYATSTCERETRGAVFKKQQFITVCYSTCVRIEMKQGQFSKKSNWWQHALNSKKTQFSKNNNLLQYAIQLVCVLKWNKRDSFQKKTTIYYSMLFNLCAYWNETRGTVFKKIQLMTICYWTRVRNETRGAVFKKQQFITVCYSTCVRIEMKQEGQFSKNKKQYAIQLVSVLKWNNNLLQYAIQLVCILKWNKRDSFQKNPIDDNMLLNSCAKWNKRGSFQKTSTIYYSMLFNLCAYWNETRGAVFKKQQFITVCYSTCVRIEMKQEGQFSKNKKIQHKFITVCYSTCVHIEMKQEGQFSKKTIDDNMLLNLCAKWNKRGSFQKTTIYYSMLFNLCAYWNETRGTVFPINDNMLNKRGSFQKTTIYYSMLFNLCAYWNETRGTVFKKQQFITVCYSTCVRIEMKQEGQFSKKKNTNLLQYAIQLVCILKLDSFQKNPINDNMLLNLCAKWNKRGSFQKTTIYYSMLFNLCAYWNETRGTVFKKKKKHQFITVCYSTCVHIEMKQEGQFSKKSKKNPSFIYDNMLLNLCAKWNKRGSFQKTTIYYSMLFNLCAYWNETRGTVFKKTTIYYSMLFNLCAYWNETRGAVFKKQQFITVCYSTCVRIEMKQEGQFSKKNKKHQFITVCYSTCMHIEMKQDGQFSKKSN